MKKSPQTQRSSELHYQLIISSEEARRCGLDPNANLSRDIPWKREAGASHSPRPDTDQDRRRGLSLQLALGRLWPRTQYQNSESEQRALGREGLGHRDGAVW